MPKFYSEVMLDFINKRITLLDITSAVTRRMQVMEF